MVCAFALSLTVVVAVVTRTSAFIHDANYYDRLFYDHMLRYNISFSDGDDFNDHLMSFSQNADDIEKHNQVNEVEHNDAIWGFNRFSHWSPKEFQQFVHQGGFISKHDPQEHKDNHDNHDDNKDNDVESLPKMVDWVAQGAVTSVKDQGSCGSCWAFSAVGALEGAYYLKYHVLKSFSEQQLVSCDTTCNGCNGCNMNTAFKYVMTNKGLPTESNYPYTSGNTGNSETCQNNHFENSKVTPTGFSNVSPNNVFALMSALVKQPISVAVEADQSSWQIYQSGIITSGCGTKIDHAVLLVGYGTMNGVNYWKVKNSWGNSWGDNGYAYILRSSANTCGILLLSSYPTL